MNTATRPPRTRTPALRTLARAMLALTALGGVSLAYADTASDGWRTLYEEEGVVVSTHEEPGVDLPGMRGQARLHADVRHVLAIVLDDERSTEWAKGADKTRIIGRTGRGSQLIYAHSDQPWPVRDRDLVMKRTVEVLAPGKAYRVHLVCIPGERPILEDVVRVLHCETSFVLRSIDATHTEIDYRVQADPGGKIPTWLVRRASRSIPFDTLRALARQIELTRGQYDPRAADRAFAQN